MPVSGPWVLLSTVGGTRTWQAPSPVRTRTLFYSRAPEDMALVRRTRGADSFDGAREVSYRSGLSAADKAGSWELSERAIRVRRPASEGPPPPDEYAVRYPHASERERKLNLDESGLEGVHFLRRSLQLGDTTRTGLLLPAPGEVSWDLEIPAGAVFDLAPMILPPEAADPATRSEGARLRVEVSGQVVWEGSLSVGEAEPVRVDLSRFGGETHSLRLVSDPDGDPALDYVFIADPVVFVPEAEPARVVVIFIDTLRPDHMSIYGSARDTTPHLAAWAEQGAVFEQARSVAPWTLPSTRAILQGEPPEQWGWLPNAPERLAAQGWATAFIAGNVYLSGNFDMARGFGTHRCINWPRAAVQLARAREFLSDHADRSTFLLLHFMDLHLPYEEPLRYRKLYAGERPAALDTDGFLRTEVMRASNKLGAEGKQYVMDRYDQSLRYLDDQISSFLDELGPKDTVVLLADHGEEFWDHDGFEHGHSLYDELLRVPLVVHGPGIAPGRHAEPVSLLDVAPTLLTAAGIDPVGMEGIALQELIDGGAEASARFEARAQAFGRPLYGERQWAVMADAHKYLAAKGKDELYNLEEDPGEQVDLSEDQDPQPWWDRMSEALAQPVLPGWRLTPGRGRSGTAIEADLHVPGGVRAAWVAEEPTNHGHATVEVKAEEVHIRWTEENEADLEVFVIPEGDPEELLSQLILEVRVGEKAANTRQTWLQDTENPPHLGEGGRLLEARASGRTVGLGWAVTPLPPDEATALAGFDPEVQAELQALGYVGGD